MVFIFNRLVYLILFKFKIFFRIDLNRLFFKVGIEDIFFRRVNFSGIIDEIFLIIFEVSRVIFRVCFIYNSFD